MFSGGREKVSRIQYSIASFASHSLYTLLLILLSVQQQTTVWALTDMEIYDRQVILWTLI
jgi:hypothetical protein